MQRKSNANFVTAWKRRSVHRKWWGSCSETSQMKLQYAADMLELIRLLVLDAGGLRSADEASENV